MLFAYDFIVIVKVVLGYHIIEY